MSTLSPDTQAALLDALGMRPASEGSPISPSAPSAPVMLTRPPANDWEATAIRKTAQRQFTR